MADSSVHQVLPLLSRPNLVGYCQARYPQNYITHKSHHTMPFVCQGMNYYANFGKWKRAALKVHPLISPEEKSVINHFQSNHCHDETGWFIITLLKKEGVEPLGESGGFAVRKFLSLQKSLQQKGQFQKFAKAVQK